MKKVIAMLLAATLCFGTLTACGEQKAAGGTEVNGGAGATQGSTDNTGSADKAAAVETIKDGVLIIGTNAAFPPFEYIGDNGEPDGFDIALANAIAEKLGLTVEVQDMEFGSLVASIGSKIDVAIAGMTITPDRLEKVDFSDSYYDAVQFVIALPGSEPKTAADLENKKIGAQLGTTGATIAEEEIKGAEAATYDKAVDAVNDLINGRVDLVIIDQNPAKVFEEKFAGKIVAIDGATFGFENEKYAIALPKDSPLVAEVNKALAEVRADGTFDALVKEYIVAE
ncbi:MAG: basic amino acid ABC transporter substrate-binding protein [Bacteroidales bacterium]|nr:basic amino acid ABC transporter substrate-binding protein [Lachnoclostridium sp.]MCM1383765.1 basic amino acid ABC transporter substrate-binding protein [Lachnoclostridium sp.]MCM1464393.1 basic amino acid ABC transporter substrate-binding protein [Bacteroidales bacterium]